MQVEQQQGNMRIYGAGGFGINIGSYFEPASGTIEPGHSAPHPVYVDTSRSNLHEDINPAHLFIMEDVDGSGKVRKENHEEISKNIKSLLQAHKPLDMNVVVFSASGGSGSVFGPLIVGELLSRGLPTICVVVGSDESNITALNTLNTLKSLEAIANKHSLPVVMFYKHNSPDIKRSVIDTDCRALIARISVLASKRNRELDSKDIQNWLQFNRTTAVKPRLALLEVYHSNEELLQATQPVSIASLYEDADTPPLTVVPEYHCAGYPREAIKNLVVMHYTITVNGVHLISKMCQERINELDKARQSRVNHDLIYSKDDVMSDDGLIL